MPGGCADDQNKTLRADCATPGTATLDSGFVKDIGMSVAERWKSEHPESAEELAAALEMKHKALEINRALGSLTGMVDDYSRLAVLYGLAGEVDTARVMLDSAQAIDRDGSRRSRIADCCSELGRILLAGNLADPAAALFQEGLRLHRSLGRNRNALEDYLGLLAVQRSNGERSSIPLLVEALEFARSVHESETMAVLLGWLAAAYLLRSQPARALPLLEEAVGIQRRDQNQPGLAETLGHLGLALTMLGRFEAADNALCEALRLNRALGCGRREADNLANLGNLYWSVELTGEARKHYEAARWRFLDLGDHRKAERVQRLLHDLALVTGAASSR